MQCGSLFGSAFGLDGGKLLHGEPSMQTFFSEPAPRCVRKGSSRGFYRCHFFLIAPCDAEQARPVVAPGRFGQPGEASHKYGAAMPSMQRRRAKRLWKFVEHKIENVCR